MKMIKRLDMAGFTPSFMLERGNSKKGKTSALQYQSWIGVIFTMIPLVLSIFYLIYLIGHMNSGQKDVYKTL